ncbi:short chain dehydrogenase [Purpureocillium lilacinum]|uniref:Short chain dehydrogenase n=1 Tax=Purpureocillium lilacinum TaxID=33203 RepID=A0A2U3E4Z7_PURLI|nr:short chain dehydrogenase [Purpureocillium lilacinum]
MSAKRIILVTGANSGIGFDTSHALAAASADHHVIMGCRSVDKGEVALRQLQARVSDGHAGTLSLLQLDITSDESIAAAAASIEATHGRLDWLVNNAGITVRNAPSRRAELLDTYNTNTAGPLILTEALLPLLRRSSDPRVVNVSSNLGSVAARFDETSSYYRQPWEAYRMSKAALNMATGCLLAAHGGSGSGSEGGVRFWAYCPGYVVTNLTGEEDRQGRIDRGADSSETSAQGILEILQGERDAEMRLFIQRWGKHGACTPDVGANPGVPWRPPGLHSHELHTLPARRARATASRVSTLPGQSAQSTASWVGQGWKRAGMDAARPPVFYLKRQHVDSSSCRQPRRRRRRALVRSMRLEQQCRPVIIIIITIAVEPRYRPAGASQIGRPCAAGWVWYRHESSYERAWGPGIKPGTRAGLLGAKPKGPKHPSIRVPVCSC